jgi:hypothetical protein
MPRLALALALSFFAATPGRSEITVRYIFSEHIVLEKAGKVPVWGEASGLPASPFRTDDFPFTTVDNKF